MFVIESPAIPTVRSKAKLPSILVVHNAFSSFVRTDCELLAKHFKVSIDDETSIRRISWTKTWKEVKQHDVIFCWFASWHSLLPVVAANLQSKPSVVIVGGYDTASIPEAAYGSQRFGARRVLARSVMKLATYLIANSNSARLEAIANAGVPSGKICTIYHGILSEYDQPLETRPSMVLTVGGVCRENLLRKGLLPFAKAASLLPNVRFVHVGVWQDNSIEKLREVSSANLEFRGFVSDQELKALYGQASVYVQASLHEGFGMSVAEAMAAGCIPVVTRCGSLPEVVGDTGIYISSQCPMAIVDGITRALSAPYEARIRAQTRIRKLFTLSKREEALKELVHNLILRTSRCSARQAQATSLPR